MNPIRVFSVIPRLPDPLKPLWEISYNLLFAWDNRIESIFVQMDPVLWRKCEQNPILFLNRISQDTLKELAEDEIFLHRLNEAQEVLRRYLSKEGASIDFPGSDDRQPAVVYLSLEYGISPCLPIYSGGLGILAGDHLKSASDLNIPLAAFGLCYKNGYFRQYMTADGWQQERYPVYDFEQMPLTLCLDDAGKPLTFGLDLAGSQLAVRIWKTQVGRVELFLLDTNFADNPPQFKAITERLYGGDLEMRLWQEILLGIGSIKALRLLGICPKVVHMNEGHSAFAGLERIRNHMANNGLSFEAASELVAATNVFTTHTPVPAGNDRFPPDLIARYFESYVRDLGLALKVFLALGREDPRNDSEEFCMTVLALRLSRFNNGVSQLHGKVSRNMWKRIWPRFPLEDVPIGAITNGVHVASWVAPDIALLYDRYLGGNWREDPDCDKAWKHAEAIPEAELWRTHERLRARLVDFVRDRLTRQLQAKGVRRREIEQASAVLDPDALIVGFARRFATYKRAGLLLSDPERLKRIVAHKSRPIQFVFAGKAHPHDQEGKKLLHDLVTMCHLEECRLSMVFLEDYDSNVARHMVQGCDVWLNTPRRPLEACGTSGMKAMVNGVLNLSTLDGWWDEAYLPDSAVGFAIGQGEEYEDHEHQDFLESQMLYNILEKEVAQLFYDRVHGGLPRKWLHRMKRNILELAPRFSAHRMVEDYATNAYLPACENFDRLSADNCSAAKELARWRMEIMTRWDGLAIRNIGTDLENKMYVGDPLMVTAEVRLGDLSPEEVSLEIYCGPMDNEDVFLNRRAVPMHPSGPSSETWVRYEGRVEPMEAGKFGFTIRALPHHPLLQDPLTLGLIYWADERTQDS